MNSGGTCESMTTGNGKSGGIKRMVFLFFELMMKSGKKVKKGERQ